MSFLIAGGTGLIGSALIDMLNASGDNAIILTRGATMERDGVAYIHWDPEKPDMETLSDSISGSDYVVNLSGTPITPTRMGKAEKEAIMKSRVDATHAIVEAIGESGSKPKALVNGSAIGFYGNRGDQEIAEESQPGNGFLSDVCKAWEEEAFRAAEYGVKVYTIRTGMVLSADGGSLPVMAKQAMRGLGAVMGDGSQWVSWIHIKDIASMMISFAKSGAASCAANGVSPNPVRNSEFADILASSLGRKKGIKIPKFALRLAMGDLADELLLSSQRALPAKAQEIGFKFEYPQLKDALEEISPKLLRSLNARR